ncbi:MAG: glycosyltransferase family 2 protein [Candidatus Methanomethyliaceae archaeon]
MKQIPKVGIVILNWNRPFDTIACLKSLSHISYRNYFSVVVDNGSTDNSPDLIRSYIPSVILLKLTKNLGFAGGANEGIKYALELNADYIMLLNNDTIVASDFLEPLVEALEQDNTIGIAVPKIYSFDSPMRIYAAGAQWTPIPPRIKIRGFGRRDNPQYNKASDIEYATGCALLVRPEVFRIAGMFDPIYFMYQEDYDFCYRVRQSGFRIIYVPKAKIWHKGSAGLGENSPDKWYQWTKSTVIFYKKHFSLVALICFLEWVFIREIVKGNFSFFKSFLRGVYEGFRTPIQGQGG